MSLRASGSYSKADRAAPITARPLRKPADTPIVGSKLVTCRGCGRRAHANRRLVKGYTIPSCTHCRETP